MTNIKRKRKKTSAVWNIPNENFIQLVKDSKSMKDVLGFFGLKSKGNNFVTAKTRIHELEIDTSHFLSRVEVSNLSRTLSVEEFQEKWLVENSDKNRNNVKKYLIKFGLMEYVCKNCENRGKWMDSDLTLQLEHINGISDDNRIQNLCFLCPNCHSQTSSYAGRNIKKYYYCDCGKQMKCKSSKHCLACYGVKNRKIVWPSKEYFEKVLWEKPTSTIAKELNMSDKAVEKHVKKLGLDKPPRGYWQKVWKVAAAVGIEP